MAIVQISRITQRKGLQENLPQLAGAEFGWSVDSRRLFIGNGTLEEGAPIIGNTEVLTEFSDILSFAEAYTYKGAAAGYTVQTGVTPGTPVSQSLQNRLDSYAIVTDFGAVGDGVTDDTDAINRALYEIYCREINPQIRRSIFFPAGVYKISDTIVIPPYATLYGEGPDNSIINFVINTWTDTVEWSAGVLVNSGGNYYRSNGTVPVGINITNTVYWDNTALIPDYVVRTGDSLQQTGANIGTNGSIVPQYISLVNLGFTSESELINIALIEDTTNADFQSVKFQGPLTTAELTTSSDPTASVSFASTPSLITTNINFENCFFGGTTYAINTDQEINSVVISESKFETLYQGVLLQGTAAGTANYVGPSGFRLVHNQFNSIYAESIIYDGAQLCASAYNMFYDVGNHFGGTTQPYTTIIKILTENNISVGDMFERSASNATTYPRITLNNTASIAITNAEQIAQGTYVRQTGQYITLVDNISSATTIFSVSTFVAKAFNVNYTITRDTAVRTGVLSVVSDSSGPVYTDDFNENSSTGIGFTVTQSGSTVSVKYTSTSTGIDAQLSYSITHLA